MDGTFYGSPVGSREKLLLCIVSWTRLENALSLFCSTIARVRQSVNEGDIKLRIATHSWRMLKNVSVSPVSVVDMSLEWSLNNFPEAGK